ncbi:GTP-binding protein [Cyclospora cayetanensis]|uniref:GTP-binding protein n=1 Tax=Cyclospora cayetanensis TaxID=88456 RepID=A0A1D3CVZ5_9EIME|nr:GTP-binding protein [Cyclospora cayetanensis]
MTKVPWNQLNLQEAYEHKIYCRVRIPLLFQFIKFILLVSAIHGLLSLPVVIGVYSHKVSDGSANCSVFNRTLFTAGCVDGTASESQLPGATNLVMVLSAVILLPILFRQQEHLRRSAGEQVFQPQDFALLLEGFPADATDEHEITSFVCNSLLANQPPECVVKVVIGFDTRHYEEHITLIERLKRRLDILKSGEPQQEPLSTNSVRLLLERVGQDILRSTGYAVVVFKYAQVEPAPNPEDIAWENLSYSKAKRIFMQVTLWAVALGLCVVSFCTAAILIIFNISLKNKAFTGTGITMIKPVEEWILSIRIDEVQETLAIHSSKERHISRTGEQTAFMVRLTITYTINTGLTYIIVLQDPRWWYVRGGLIECIAMQFFSFLLSEIGLSLLQTQWLARVVQRNCLLPLTRKPISQEAFNRLYEGPDFCTATKYAAMLQGLCSLSLYVSIAPFLSLQAMSTWAILYWVYKVALLRLAKRPNPEMTAAIYKPENKASTWRTMHYYKLQHTFFAKYHGTHPVYASWGQEKNPDILSEPGFASCSNATAKEFAARGAGSRAQRRMAAIGGGLLPARLRRMLSKATSSLGTSTEEGRASSKSNSSSNVAEDNAIFDVTETCKLRATLVKGRAAPEIQRLLMQCRMQRWSCPPHERASFARAFAVPANAPKNPVVESSSKHSRVSTASSGESVAKNMTEKDAEPPQSSNEVVSGPPIPGSSFSARWNEAGASDEQDDFCEWLCSVVLRQLSYADCLFGALYNESHAASTSPKQTDT